MPIREIERSPVPPRLNDKAIELLTQLCFRPNDKLEKADLIFAFSSTSGLKEYVKTIKGLIEYGVSNRVLITGGAPKYTDSLDIPEAESITVLKLIKPENYPWVEFYTEINSNNTLENVTEALKVLNFQNYKTIIFVFKKHTSKRGHLTLKRFLPDAKLIQHAFSHVYEGTDRALNEENWHTYDLGKSRVWGEYLRIRLYGQRGDIVYDENVRYLVEQIEKNTANV